MKTVHLALRLLKNALRFQYLRHTGKPGKPQAVSHTIDALCRLREKSGNLVLGVKTTILPLNIDELGGAEFMQLHRHMGLDKYLNI